MKDLHYCYYYCRYILEFRCCKVYNSTINLITNTIDNSDTIEYIIQLTKREEDIELITTNLKMLEPPF